MLDFASSISQYPNGLKPSRQTNEPRPKICHSNPLHPKETRKGNSGRRDVFRAAIPRQTHCHAQRGIQESSVCGQAGRGLIGRDRARTYGRAAGEVFGQPAPSRGIGTTSAACWDSTGLEWSGLHTASARSWQLPDTSHLGCWSTTVTYGWRRNGRHSTRSAVAARWGVMAQMTAQSRTLSLGNHCNLLKNMAGTTGLEPAASAVTGQRSNQLNYVPNRGINNLP